MVCKGHCTSQAVKKMPYATGVKRCTDCAVYFEATYNKCPCCGKQLRAKPQNNKYRKNYTLKQNKV